ncbi:hypothetical protein WR25_15820 isoform B [Diploscapter pachys]|uniref:Uncharacterized protein n=1 Tax=Diploscapter pachys TaxID=2018661 RepID=A0A2A2JJA6_9BILA|nr:hypothetical protein WR25_15820 isoform B [Diploscapter pachys]
MKVEELSRLRPGSGRRIWCVAWHFSGDVLASSGEDKTIRIWKRTPNPPYFECRSTVDDSHTRAIRCVAFSHSGNLLASASFDGATVVYALEDSDYTESNKLEGHESEVKWVAFSPSDEFLATCGRDKSVWFWQVNHEDDDFEVVSVISRHTQDVKFVGWSPVEDLAVSCSYDGSLNFYQFDGDEWKTTQTIKEAHTGTIWSAAFDSSGKSLVSVGEDRHVKLWTRQSENPTSSEQWIRMASYAVDDTRWPLYTVGWNNLNGLIAVGGGDACIRYSSFEI